MSNLNRFLSILFFLLITIEANAQIDYSQTDFSFIGVGARARGMGNSHIAAANDESAIYWNPAGMTRINEVSRISLSALFNHDSHAVNDTSLSSVEEPASHGTFNFLGLSSPFSIFKYKASMGVAYYKVIDFYRDEGDAGSELIQSSSGGVDVLSPSLAFALHPNISLGLSYNFYTGKYKFNDSMSNDFQHALSGENVTVGVQYLQNKLMIGTVFRTPFSLKIDQPDSVFSITMPAMFGVGIAYQVGENLLITSDYEIRTFSKSNAEDENNQTIRVLNEESGEEEDWIDWENTIAIRTGLEYQIRYGRLMVPLRGGFAKTAHPLLDGKNQQINSWMLTAGLGMQTENIQLDISAEYAVANWSDKVEENIFSTRAKNSLTILSTVTIIWTK